MIGGTARKRPIIAIRVFVSTILRAECRFSGNVLNEKQCMEGMYAQVLFSKANL